jgi:hypothetical protein
VTGSTDIYADYLHDLGGLIRDLALAAKRERDGEGSSGGYSTGRMMAFHEVISLMQQQAIAFNIPFEALQLSGIDPERDIV